MKAWRAPALALALSVLAAEAGRAAAPPPAAGKRRVAVPPESKQPGPATAHDAASVAGAPSTEQASGVARGEPESSANRWRVVPRVLLFPVRGLLALIDAPLRGSFYLYDRFELRERLKAIFFNDTGTVGLYPVALIETGFGLNAGVRFIHRDLYRKASLKVRASFGGRYQQIYAIKLGSGEILGERIELELEGESEIRPKDRFFGIGNGDVVAMVPAPVDPYLVPVAVDTRFRQSLGRVSAIANVKLVGPLSVRLSAAFLRKTFNLSDPADIVDAQNIALSYDTGALPGFEQGTSYTYQEVELRLDTRRSVSRYELETVPSTGWLLAPFSGVAAGFVGAPTHYVRYGVDLQRYYRLAENPRLIALRAYLEGVAGDLDQIPFVDLPRLGGAILLRGYDQDRFRDRVLALTSAEYEFDIGHMLTGFLFVDVGRVYPELSEIDVKDLRTGFGGGLQLQTPKTFVGRLTLASTVEGGFFFNLSFDPVYDPKARVERK